MDEGDIGRGCMVGMILGALVWLTIVLLLVTTR